MGTHYTLMLWQDSWGTIASVYHDKEPALASIEVWRWLPYDERPMDSLGESPGEGANLAVCDQPTALLAGLISIQRHNPNRIRYARQWDLAKALANAVVNPVGGNLSVLPLRLLLEAVP